MKPLLPHLLTADPFVGALEGAVQALAPGEQCVVSGTAGSLAALILAELQHRSGRQVLVIVPEKDTAVRVSDDLAALTVADSVRLFVGREGL